MIRNINFVIIAVFWVVMNSLLWHSEMGRGNDLASSVPLSTVWEKILAAPDDSTLSIVADGRKVGYLRWRPNVGEELATGKIASENEPEGIVRNISRYTIELEGSFLVKEMNRTIKLNANLVFDRQLQWQEFSAQASQRPMVWQVKSKAAEKDIWFQLSDGESEWIKRFAYDELTNPERLANELGLPFTELLAGPTGKTVQLNSQMKWQAKHDWLKIGRSRVRIYRLEGRLIDRFSVVVLVSRVGEILRVELPGGLKLLNDALFAM